MRWKPQSYPNPPLHFRCCALVLHLTLPSVSHRAHTPAPQHHQTRRLHRDDSTVSSRPHSSPLRPRAHIPVVPVLVLVLVPGLLLYRPPRQSGTDLPQRLGISRTTTVTPKSRSTSRLDISFPLSALFAPPQPPRTLVLLSLRSCCDNVHPLTAPLHSLIANFAAQPTRGAPRPFFPTPIPSTRRLRRTPSYFVFSCYPSLLPPPPAYLIHATRWPLV
ncbi:uncharacterized protein J3D65DRAFT_196576 [Phyllosticta citribraziliensis]|uniref:Uncharacterized protein n=1 Tax=Phyllosticta citribraziliensis TaxID=989973 RepID=A0ABR1M4T0_9PEZI